MMYNNLTLYRWHMVVFLYGKVVFTLGRVNFEKFGNVMVVYYLRRCGILYEYPLLPHNLTLYRWAMVVFL